MASLRKVPVRFPMTYLSHLQYLTHSTVTGTFKHPLLAVASLNETLEHLKVAVISAEIRALREEQSTLEWRRYQTSRAPGLDRMVHNYANTQKRLNAIETKLKKLISITAAHCEVDFDAKTDPTLSDEDECPARGLPPQQAASRNTSYFPDESRQQLALIDRELRENAAAVNKALPWMKAALGEMDDI